MTKYVDYAKVIAILLVLNSHMDSLYPISSLAVGGALGNSLFFFVSGYTWVGARKRNFGEWYQNKLLRIYMPTLFTNTIYLILFEQVQSLSVGNFFEIFIYPNKSWFCGAILVYAVIYYFVVRINNQKKRYLAESLFIVIYIIWYLFILDKSVFNIESLYRGGLCRFCFYLLTMFAGMEYRLREENRIYKIRNKQQCIVLGIITVIFFVSSYAWKIGGVSNTALLNTQFMCQIFTMICCLSLFQFLVSIEEILKKTSISNQISKVASYSWEIYLTQTLIIPLCDELSFPGGIVVAIIAIIISSILLKHITNIALKVIEGAR